MKKMRKYPKEQFRNSPAYDPGFSIDTPHSGLQFHRFIHLILESFAQAGYTGPFLDGARTTYPIGCIHLSSG